MLELKSMMPKNEELLSFRTSLAYTMAYYNIPFNMPGMVQRGSEYIYLYSTFLNNILNNRLARDVYICAYFVEL